MQFTLVERLGGVATGIAIAAAMCFPEAGDDQRATIDILVDLDVDGARDRLV
ncbi:MAG: hypothetical protein GY917_32065 [Planctomycetaceae bacterium]|nr:hypothetical protein [Planctomycetaceae bacterium]